MLPSPAPTVLGVDIGGTFTDFVLVHNGAFTVHKRLSTPDDPSRAFLEGAAHLNLPPSASIVHGSTIATNALLERHGARTALVTTRGFADVLEIGRQNRPDLYALMPVLPLPLVPAGWRFEVAERIAADGSVLEALDEADLPALVEAVREAGIESVAVSLLFSFLYPRHEQMIGEALRPYVSVSLSSDILPEHREYERTSTTVVNAYVAPLMERYLARVEAGLQGHPLHIMQSNGGVITAVTARREAARTVLSGPAGGAVGAFHVGRMAGFDHIISFDMGGTSTDVALFPGLIVYTREAQVGGAALRLPIVDVHTVGAGGGSIARVDAGGALHVGPQSAGATPGPACYGYGDLPTTTDANLVLGRLHPDHFLGGQMRLDADRARSAMEQLAREMSVDTAEQAAWGVIQVANATMQRAIRAISIEQGHDPRGFTLLPFGGAGPLHACALADAMRIRRIIVPRSPGVLSALGMTIADLIKDYAQAVLARQNVLGDAALATIFGALERRACDELEQEGVQPHQIQILRSLDMRYVGQAHEINVSQPASSGWLEAFHAEHQRRFGHRHDAEPVEIVNARVQAVGRGPKPELALLEPGGPDSRQAQVGQGQVWFSMDRPVQAACYERDLLRAGNRVPGPALIFQLDATILIEPGWDAVVDQWGNLSLSR
jgi:N-methylhydantoinase A